MKKPAKIYSCWKDYAYQEGSSIRRAFHARNRKKLVKLYINKKEVGYLYLDKLNKNLHIEFEGNEEDINLFTDY